MAAGHGYRARMDSLISISEVTKRYQSGGQPAVDRIRLEVAPGEAVAVMGPSGSGKSTLLNLIAGLDRPTSGTVTVADNVLLPAQLTGIRRARARARLDELLAALRIERHRDAYPARLSGGERQRVAIARALVNRPALLLADEPTGALDTATGEQIGELLLDLNRSGQTMVLVTHNPGLADRYASRTLRLVDGRVASDVSTGAQL